MSKYHSVKVRTSNGEFDSKRESRRYNELRLLLTTGRISNLRRQVKYTLIPSQRDESGKVVERECSYIADFVYTQNGKTIVEDVKGYRTAAYIIKRKLMLYVHGIKIKET